MHVPKLLRILSVLDVAQGPKDQSIPNLAVRLEQAGLGTARAWLAMQSAHDQAAERAARARLDDVA